MRASFAATCELSSSKVFCCLLSRARSARVASCSLGTREPKIFAISSRSSKGEAAAAADAAATGSTLLAFGIPATHGQCCAKLVSFPKPQAASPCAHRTVIHCSGHDGSTASTAPCAHRPDNGTTDYASRNGPRATSIKSSIRIGI